MFCRLTKLIQVKTAILQRFHLAFKHLLHPEKNSRLHPTFQDFAFNFHTFSRSEKVARKFPDSLYGVSQTSCARLARVLIVVADEMSATSLRHTGQLT